MMTEPPQMTRKQLAERHGVPPATLYTWLTTSAEAPQPVRIGAYRARLYDVAEVDAWWTSLDRTPREAERDAPPDGSAHGTETAYRRERCRCLRCQAWRSGSSARERTGQPRAYGALSALVDALCDPTLTDGEVDHIAQSLARIASPARLRLLGAVQESDRATLTTIARRVGAARLSTVAYHLAALCQVGLVERSAAGRIVYWWRRRR